MLARAATLLIRHAEAVQAPAAVHFVSALAVSSPLLGPLVTPASIPSQSRMMSAAAAPSPTAEIKLPTAPLQLPGTSASIATLAWQCAFKENVLDKVQDEIHQMAEVIRTLPELRRLATDPFVPTVVRKAIVESIMKDSKATEVTKRLFVSMAEENCLAAVFEVAAAFDDLQLADKKEVYVTIVTAAPLDKMEKIELRKQAEAFVPPGFKLVSKEKLDKKLLGGFILEFEDRLVDMSKAKKIEEYNNMVARLEADLL
eukprot:gene22058-29123_t